MKELKYLSKFYIKYRWRFALGVFFVVISNLFAIFPAVYTRKSFDWRAQGVQVTGRSSFRSPCTCTCGPGSPYSRFGLVCISRSSRATSSKSCARCSSTRRKRRDHRPSLYRLLVQSVLLGGQRALGLSEPTFVSVV